MPPGRGGRSWGRAVPWALLAAEVAGDATAWEAGTGPTVTGLVSRKGSFRDELPFSPPASSDEIRQDGLVASKQASSCPSACSQHTAGAS